MMRFSNSVQLVFRLRPRDQVYGPNQKQSQRIYPAIKCGDCVEINRLKCAKNRRQPAQPLQ